MGFLLGKVSDETLTSFDVVNQDPRFESGMNPERSLNRTLQTYKFSEKGEFNMEFSFFTEAKYRELVYMLNNRNSLREGLLMLPVPYSEYPSTCILTPTYNTTNKCWYCYWPSLPNEPWGKDWAALLPGLTELSQAQYGKILHYDANHISVDGGGAFYQGFVFQFDLSNFATQFSTKELRRLTLSYVGMRNSPVHIFIYSPSKAAWYLVEDKFYYDDSAFDPPPYGSGAFSLYKGLTAGFGLPWGLDSIKDDFLDGSNLVKFMVVGDFGAATIIQYARLLVNGYWVTSMDANGVEKFSNAFTGAGRSGTIKLMEI